MTISSERTGQSYTDETAQVDAAEGTWTSSDYDGWVQSPRADGWVTLLEASVLTQRHPSTLRRWIHQGRLSAHLVATPHGPVYHLPLVSLIDSGLMDDRQAEAELSPYGQPIREMILSNQSLANGALPPPRPSTSLTPSPSAATEETLRAVLDVAQLLRDQNETLVNQVTELQVEVRELRTRLDEGFPAAEPLALPPGAMPPPPVRSSLPNSTIIHEALPAVWGQAPPPAANPALPPPNGVGAHAWNGYAQAQPSAHAAPVQGYAAPAPSAPPPAPEPPRAPEPAAEPEDNSWNIDREWEAMLSRRRALAAEPAPVYEAEVEADPPAPAFAWALGRLEHWWGGPVPPVILWIGLGLILAIFGFWLLVMFVSFVPVS